MRRDSSSSERWSYCYAPNFPETGLKYHAWVFWNPSFVSRYPAGGASDPWAILCKMSRLQGHLTQRLKDLDNSASTAHFPDHGQNEPRPHFQWLVLNLGMFAVDRKGSTVFTSAGVRWRRKSLRNRLVGSFLDGLSQQEDIPIYQQDRDLLAFASS